MNLAALIDELDDVLPQTQCTQCGFDGCRPYAEAMAAGRAGPERCPPGDEAGAARLAAILGVAPRPLDRTRGQPGPLRVAVIDEAHCIGCTLCIRACPVDAIAGANKRMHTVLAADCTGCELCVAPCPVDCIVMVPAQPARAWNRDDALQARRRFERRNARLARVPAAARAAAGPVAAPRATTAGTDATRPAASAEHKHAAVAAALARARARRTP